MLQHLPTLPLPSRLSRPDPGWPQGTMDSSKRPAQVRCEDLLLSR